MSTVLGPNFSDIALPWRGDGERLEKGPSTAVEGSGEVTITWDGLQPGQIREWQENNAPYENLASDPEVADRAKAFVLENIRHYEQKTRLIQRKWQVLNYLLQGNSLVSWEDPDGVHSPKLYQHVEILESLITESILDLNNGSGEWFVARGREESDWRQEEVLAAYLDYTLDKNKFKQKVPEMVRTMLVHSFCVLKTYWENDVRRVVKRTRSKEVTSRGIKWKTMRKEQDAILYSGPRFKLVDPFWFLCDTSETHVEDMLFCGDRFKVTLEQALEQERQGIWENTDQLFGQEPRTWGEWMSDWIRASRGPTSWYDALMGATRPTGAPRQFFGCEIWGKFAARKGEETRDYLTTLVNGTTVVQVRENPLDDKRKPYCIARACKYPFDFHSVGPLDHAIPLSIEIDTHRSLGVQGSRLAVCPIGFTDHKQAIGDSLYEVEPGKIFDVPAGAISFTQIKSPVPEMAAMENILAADMERTTGAIAEYQTSGEQGAMTAYEYRGRVQHGSKRIRSFIRGMTDMCTELLQNFHGLCAQFLTTTQKFRVLGNRGKILRQWEEVSPPMFDQHLDFEFAAVSNLHVAGMEATNLQLFMNTWAPFMAQSPGALNIPKAMQRHAALLLGDKARDLVHVPEDPRDLMSQEDEIILLRSGSYVPVSEGDDDEDHLRKLDLYRMSSDYRNLPEHVRTILDEHYYEHENQKGYKSRARRAQTSRMMPFMPPEMAAYPGQGSPPAMRNMERSNQSGGLGQANGPTNGQQIASPGRMNPYSQEQNLGGNSQQ